MKLRSAILLLALAASACAGSTPASDAGATDAGKDAGFTTEQDAGPTDAGPVDAGPADAGPEDAGPIDAGPIDAGPIDAGPVDAGPIDAGPNDAGPVACIPGGDGGYVHVPPFGSISQYCMVSLAADGGVAFNPSVTPYDLNTPLFSDYAVKVRGVWMPPGTSATYNDTNAFTFPVGTVLIKSFGLRNARGTNVRWVETRLLINTAADAGWKGYDYLWNDAGTDATINYGGGIVPLTWIDIDGGPVPVLLDADGGDAGPAYYLDVDAGLVKFADGSTVYYPIPSYGQCQQCHESYSVMTPIGPKARNLNKNFDYATGTENELAHWTDAGILTGAPDPSQAPRVPVWNNPSTGTLNERARAYLDVNCAHCHSEGGFARTTGLYLGWNEDGGVGVGKAPVAAGPCTAGLDFDVVPGDPADSIMISRMRSISPGCMMPLIGRTVVDTEGVALVSDWITCLGFDGGCP
ncbi:MAG: hypothetical protein JST54_31890 [Deltaproteobacteria bacterium]|nr:hypothetical protein [Deltaproteobacteria bacterium]